MLMTESIGPEFQTHSGGETPSIQTVQIVSQIAFTKAAIDVWYEN